MIAQATLIDDIAWWRRLILLCFLIYIMFVYPTINRIDESSLGNRLLLLVLLVTVFGTFVHYWLDFMRQPWDLASGLLMIYLLLIVISTLASIALGIQSPRSILTYGLNSFAPLVLYGCFVRFPARRFVINTIILFTVINVFLGAATFGALGLNVPYVSDVLRKLVFDPEAHRLVSLVGKSTVVGYLSLFGFGWILFFHPGRGRYPLLAILGVAVVLSFQRSMWAGLMLVMAVYFAFSPGKTKGRDLAVLGLALTGVVLALSAFAELSGVAKLLWDRVAEFDVGVALAERSEQQLLLNTENAAQIVLGEGYGKYSPVNKQENVLNLPDAPYYMIYNETGVLGMAVFIGMLLAFGGRALVRGNMFQCWLVVHLAIALIGSRVLWYFPLNFLIIMILAMLKDDRRDTPELLLRVRPA